MGKGLKNAYLMHFLSLLFWFHCRVCYYVKCSSSPSLSLWKGQTKGQKLFLFKIHFNSCIIINQSQMRPSEKITKQLTVRGGGVPPPGLTVAFVKILGLKTHWIWFLDTQNTFYLMVKGLKNAYLMHFSSLHSWFHCRGCYYLKCSSSLSQSLCKGQIKGQKTFFGQNSFQLMYNHKPKSNAPLRKNHKTADRKGGDQPLRSAWP